MLDEICDNLFEQKPNMMIPYYLMAAYAYYHESDPIFNDSYFDSLAKRIYNDWDNIEHMHKQYLSKDDLKAGTYLGEYPMLAISGLGSLRTTHAKILEEFGKQVVEKSMEKSTLDNFF